MLTIGAIEAPLVIAGATMSIFKTSQLVALNDAQYF
jgi:hypothetical protein